MSAWLKVSEDSLDGALTMIEDIQLDMPMHGRRVEKLD